MDKEFKKRLREESDRYEELKGEPHFKAYELLEELVPLLGDYFAGEAKIEGESIVWVFPNGQKFCVTAKELK